MVCPKCGGEMKEHKTTMKVAAGIMKYNSVKANVCEQCRFVELYMGDKPF